MSQLFLKVFTMPLTRSSSRRRTRSNYTLLPEAKNKQTRAREQQHNVVPASTAKRATEAPPENQASPNMAPNEHPANIGAPNEHPANIGAPNEHPANIGIIELHYLKH